MENYSNPKEWSDEQIIEYLCSYWNCDDFVFDCTINDKPYKTSHPENFKGSITNITNNSKLICYPYSRYPIFFNILATTKFQFQKGIIVKRLKVVIIIINGVIETIRSEQIIIFRKEYCTVVERINNTLL